MKETADEMLLGDNIFQGDSVRWWNKSIYTYIFIVDNDCDDCGADDDLDYDNTDNYDINDNYLDYDYHDHDHHHEDDHSNHHHDYDEVDDPPPPRHHHRQYYYLATKRLRLWWYTKMTKILINK